jgi:enoyl-CoA hydratase/carnithine racemase
MTRLPKPMWAVQGFASGYGMSLALGCDLVVAAESTRFNMAYVLVGLAPDGGSSYFLPRFAGIKRALEIFFTGDFMDAQEAQRLGIVNRVVPDAELEQAALDVARWRGRPGDGRAKGWCTELGENAGAPARTSARPSRGAPPQDFARVCVLEAETELRTGRQQPSMTGEAPRHPLRTGEEKASRGERKATPR